MLYAALGGFSTLPTYCCSQELKSQGWRSLSRYRLVSLVEGVILSYFVQSKGNLYLLGAGVVLALLAAVLISKAYGSLSGIRSGTSRKDFIICIVSGVLMGAFASFNAHALIAAHPLTPYSIAVFFALGAFACCFVCNTYLMRHPLVGTPVDFVQHYPTGISQHAIGLAGGSIWGNRHGVQPSRGNLVGIFVSYAVGQTSPMIVALCGMVRGSRYGRGEGVPKRFIWGHAVFGAFFSCL